MNNTFIYSLSDPITSDVRYIGKANNPKRRYANHLFAFDNFHKSRWIKSLLNKELKPILEIIDEVPITEWQFWEQHYISLYKSWGFNLTNISTGGDGGGVFGWRATDETKARMRLAQLGKKLSSETKEKLRIAHTGKKLSASHIEKMRIANLGKKMSAESIAKTAAANRGRKNTQEMKDKLSAKFKGRKVPPDILLKRSRAQWKPIIQLDLEGNFIKEWESVKSARMALSPNNHGLSGILKGQWKTWQGYKWKYKQ